MISQAAGSWEIMGRHNVAESIVDFLADAQKEFSSHYGKSGPFMPVFKDGSFGWEGPDPNTHWMGFQYRTFAHLAHYYYLTGDKKAKKILENFVSWINKNTQNINGRLSVPQELHNSGANIGNIRRLGYDPHAHGLISQGLIYMAARDNDANLKKKAELFLDDLANNRKSSKGSYKYVDPDPDNTGTYGFHNAEVGIALCLYELLLDN